MSEAYFMNALEERVVDLLKPVVGEGSDPVDYIKSWEYYLTDLNFDPRNYTQHFPFVVVSSRGLEQMNPGEMGTRMEINNWNVHIYYIDVVKEYEEGRQRRAKLVHLIQKTLELEPRLGELAVTAPNDSITTKVYDSNFSSIQFDSSGQEGYYSFVSELYLNVGTSKN